MDMTQGIHLQLALNDNAGKTHWYRLGTPYPVSREVSFNGETHSPNAFHLPVFTTQTFQYKDVFTGDVDKGGSCNVDILQYVPHGLTHLETSAHLLSPAGNPPTVKDIPIENLTGLIYLIDLSHLGKEPGQTVPWEPVKKKLEENKLPITMLAIKTHASMLPQDYDFSGKNFLALSPEAAKGIHNYRFPSASPEQERNTPSTRIDCLLLDLPSIDPEQDRGLLLAHRHYFGLPLTGTAAKDTKKRALVELAWFSNLKEGYYYATITPPRFQANAVSTGITFRPLIEIAVE